tara:strand:- start:799 stop:1437 length:639 start_codon:yes stop_codon:yes gene_type:complete
MAKKPRRGNAYKIIPESFAKNLVSFLDEIQFDAAGKTDNDSMQLVNFCSWAIEELLSASTGVIKHYPFQDDKPKKKTRDQYVDETFMDWNLPEMSDEEYMKLVDQFDAFLRGWEKEYNKKNKNNPKKEPINERPKTFRPKVQDVAEYCTLKEIEEMLKDDPELSDEERFELYYEEHCRVEREKDFKKAKKDMNKMLKEIGLSPYKPNKTKKK